MSTSRIRRPHPPSRMLIVAVRPPVAANDAAPVPPSEVITIEELAALLRMGPKNLYDLVAEGKVPGTTKVGRVWRVHRPTVVAWLSGQISAPQPPKKGGRR